ncbi:TPA: glycosyltransferase [Vibrio cholerae]|nr:glycosyltransferase [Vibrio cholerae]HAS3590322.1 glycosyltransferase [Vibrio cholerae]
MTNVIIDNRRHKQPIVSIVIVTFNASKTLRKTLDSIFNLNLETIEVVVVDGDSDDDTVKILKEYREFINYAISEHDKGIYDAMNKGVKLSKGKYVYFLGGDDLLLPDFFKMAKLAEESNDILYSNVRILSSGESYLGKFSKYKLMQCNICHQSIFYPKDILMTEMYDLTYPLLADYALNITLFSKYHFEYIKLDICLYNDQGASSSGDKKFELDKLTLIKDNFGSFYFFAKKIRNFLIRFKF